MDSDASGASSNHILVVDKEESHRSRVSGGALREAGYQVTAVEGAAEALETMESSREFSEHIDLMLTNLVMPGLTALELMDRLRSRGVNVPTIVMTGMGDASMLHAMLHGRCAAFLRRPVELQRLLSQVKQALCEDGAG